jgi:hypothetical protein
MNLATHKKLMLAMIQSAPPSTPTLPDEYQLVEYIESQVVGTSGTYIQTPVIATHDSEIEFKFCATLANIAINVAYGTTKYFCFGRTSTNTYSFRFNTPTIQNSYITQTDFKNLATVKISKEGFYVNGVRANNEISQDVWTDTDAIKIFASNGGFASGGVRGADFIWREAGVKKMHLVPCYRKSDKVIGMYDLCGTICPLTGTPFYINAGANNFLKGADVNDVL